MKLSYLAGALLGAPATLFFVAVNTAPAQANWVCGQSGSDYVCTNTGDAGFKGIFVPADGVGPNAIVTNSGTVNGYVNAEVDGDGNSTVNNSGTVNSYIRTWATGRGNATTINSGTVSEGIGAFALGDGDASTVNSGFVSASGSITTSALGDGNATATNSGTVDSGIYTSALGNGDATATNSGTANGPLDTYVQNSGNAISVNSGIINDYVATHAGYEGNGNAIMINTGTVNGEIATFADGTGDATTINSGRVNGDIYMRAMGGGTSVLVNSGTIINPNWGVDPNAIAIYFGTGNDKLTLDPGSFIVGGIHLAGANDTVNINAGNVNLTFESLANATVNGSVPFVVAGNRIVSVDPTTFGLADRTLMDFTGAVSGFVNSGPDETPGSLKDPQTLSVSNLDGTTVWAKGFYGEREQNESGGTLGNSTRFSGGTIGLESKLLPGWTAGVFEGGGTIKTSLDGNAGTATTDIGFGGIYTRYEDGALYLNAALIGGGLSSTTIRNVNNNMLADGRETATGGFNGWFLEPEVAVGYHLGLGNNWTLTPALKLRYLAAGYDGYNETSPGIGLAIDARTVEDIEGRAELMIAYTRRFVSGEAIRVSAHAGALGLERFGGTTVEGTLLDQNISFATPGNSDVLGYYTGADAEMKLGDGLSVFGAGEYTHTEDSASVTTLKGGVRMEF